MKHAELCPLCNGKGKLGKSDLAYPYFGLDDSGTCTMPVSVPCHGCGGKGWVEVEGEVVSIPGVQIPPLTPFDFTVTTLDGGGEWHFYPGVK